MASNTLGEWSDGEDDFVFDINENVWEWDDPEADALISNINEDEVQVGQDDPEADDLIANINEDEILARAYGNDDDEDEVQVGRGQKRGHQSDQESESEDEQGQYYYQLESRTKYHSKKFGITATNHRVRFNNVLADRDLLESYRTTHKIIYHLLEDVTEGMAPNDQVRFILRSEQLETPISLPFMPVERLTAERVFSALERVIQSNEEFRLNDTVTIDINHAKSPQGSGGKKRTTFNIDDFLNKKGSVVRIQNNDDICLARALVVARAKKDNDPMYKYIRRSDRPLQREKAFELHRAAKVPLGPCGLKRSGIVPATPYLNEDGLDRTVLHLAKKERFFSKRKSIITSNLQHSHQDTSAHHQLAGWWQVRTTHISGNLSVVFFAGCEVVRIICWIIWLVFCLINWFVVLFFIC